MITVLIDKDITEMKVDDISSFHSLTIWEQDGVPQYKLHRVDLDRYAWCYLGNVKSYANATWETARDAVKSVKKSTGVVRIFENIGEFINYYYKK